MSRLHRSTALLISCVTVLGSCDSADELDCEARIDTVDQTGTILTAHGQFTGGQPLLRLVVGADTNVIPGQGGDPEAALFDVTGVPTGVYTVTWDISCEDANANGHVTTGVKTITIK